MEYYAAYPPVRPPVHRCWGIPPPIPIQIARLFWFHYIMTAPASSKQQLIIKGDIFFVVVVLVAPITFQCYNNSQVSIAACRRYSLY